MGSYLDEAIARLKQFEGSVPWMYLDTVGKVTVGVGSMLPDEKAAGALPFQVAGRAATAEEIARDFARVSGLAKGRAAAFYRSSTGLRLPEVVIEERLREVLEGFEGYLRAHIAGYEGMPDGGKLGLLDMVYNLGPGKLFEQYPKLIAALVRGDWAGAAAACLRRGPSAERNAWTRAQFATAAKRVAIQAEAELERVRWGWVAVLVGAGAALAVVLAAGRRKRG